MSRSKRAGWLDLRIVLTCAIAALCTLVGTASADERKVFLNGIDLVDVDVRGHQFKGCEVRFDDQGNVHITVKGLKIGTTADRDQATKPTDKRLGKKHFLVIKPVRKNGDKYRLSVYINGKLFKVVKGLPQMQVHDITRLVKSGDNTVRLVSARSVAGKTKGAPSDDLEIVVGRGRLENGTVLIQVPHVEYRRQSSDVRQYDKKHRFKIGR